MSPPATRPANVSRFLRIGDTTMDVGWKNRAGSDCRKRYWRTKRARDTLPPARKSIPSLIAYPPAPAGGFDADCTLAINGLAPPNKSPERKRRDAEGAPRLQSTLGLRPIIRSRPQLFHPATAPPAPPPKRPAPRCEISRKRNRHTKENGAWHRIACATQ